jgi:lysophospholipase L1-like esterase
MQRLFGAAFGLALIWLAASAGTAGAGSVPLPRSIAAIGDSITQAYDVCCWYGNHPSNSWSTGGASWDGVKSHYERILAVKPGIAGHKYNDAVSGARMGDAPVQAKAAVSQGARYVTILMGANDLCTSSIGTMTPADTFASEFRSTLSILEAGLPSSSHIFVSSIPDVYRLWQLFHANSIATAVWSTAHICQSMLSSQNTDADRRLVRDREDAFNEVLNKECGVDSNCRFDGNAVFQTQFSSSDVSKLDYFHPSLAGQRLLAQVTWDASWWPSV